MEGGDPDRLHARVRNSDGTNRYRPFPGRPHRQNRWSLGTVVASLGFLFSHRDFDATDVQPGGCRGGPARSRSNGFATRTQPAMFRDDDCGGRELLLPHTARAFLSHGLRSRQVSIRRFPQDRICPLGLDLPGCNCPRAESLAHFTAFTRGSFGDYWLTRLALARSLSPPFADPSPDRKSTRLNSS